MPHKITQQEAEERAKNKNLVLLDKYINSKSKNRFLCFCGNIFVSNASSVFSKRKSSCGCGLKYINFKDITNQKFNKLLAIECLHKLDKTGNYLWKCLCDCGNFKITSINKLTTNNTKSCGKCQNIKNGKATSSIVYKLHKLLNIGVHNYNSKFVGNIDIAINYKGKKVALEYDEWYWHRDKKQADEKKNNLLLNNNWFVLRIKTRYKLPEKELILNTLESMLKKDIKYSEIKVGDEKYEW